MHFKAVIFWLLKIQVTFHYISNGNKWVSNNFACFDLSIIQASNLNLLIPGPTSPRSCSLIVEKETNYTGFCFLQSTLSCYSIPESNIVPLFNSSTIGGVSNDTTDKCCVYTKASECPPPLQLVPNVGCILVSLFHAFWQDARTFCQGFGADLWGEDPSNFQNISSYLQQEYPNGTNYQFWIFLKQIAYTTGYIYKDGTLSVGKGASKWTGWKQTCPSQNNSVDNCGMISCNQKVLFSVQDEPCYGNKHRTLCEKKLNF